MLTKFETKSNRVKGLAFHPKRPWLLASLHNGTVQLWDYRMGTLVDKYDEHEGPVRGCAFHPTQPLFVTGGDDGKIRVFNYQQRRCLFTLSGHMDYIRTVFFHHEAPWIVSASDDQTVRLWNWQSRTCVAVLTGHSHYVMCAQFHPGGEDLIVSASLDQTVRVWDVGSLRRKHSSPGASPMEDFGRGPSPRAVPIDLFGAPDGQVKFVLEGHDRGVNWAQFHPTRPMIVSGSDDRSVKLWRYNETRAWETDTFRGHFNNISCVLFHPRSDLIISNSEDKTLRIWDYTKRGSQPIIHRRESDRFWVLTAHPTLNLFAAGHDSGLVLFKLEHERPAYCVFEDSQLFYAKQDGILCLDLNESLATAAASGGADVPSSPLLTEGRPIGSLEQRMAPPALMTYSAADGALLLSSAGSSAYALFSARGGSADTGRKGAGAHAVFVSRNRFAVLDEANRQIHIKALDNTIFRTLECPEKTARLLPSTPGTLLMVVGGETVELYDLQQEQTTATLAVSGVKYAAWAADGSRLALFGRNVIYVVERRGLTLQSTIRDTISIKSVVWDARGLLYYTNSHHLKYVLPNGDVGVICTIQAPLYLLRVKNETVSALDRTCAVHHFKIDPTEYLFKLALLQGDQARIAHMVEHSNLMGQSIISYLRKNGYAEIALGFVQDPLTRFELGIESCNLEAAHEAAVQADRRDLWSRLAEEALMLGNVAMAEECLGRIGDRGRLGFLHLVTGNVAQLAQLARQVQGSTKSQDLSLKLQLSVLAGTKQDLADTLLTAGLPALAFAASKGAAGGDLEVQAAEIARTFAPDGSWKTLSLGSLVHMEPFLAREELPPCWPLTADPVKNKMDLRPRRGDLMMSKAGAGVATEARDAVMPDEGAMGGQEEEETTFSPSAATDAFNMALMEAALEPTGGWELEDSTLTLDDVEIPEGDGMQNFDVAEEAGLPAAAPACRERLLQGSNSPFHYLALGEVETAMKMMREQSGVCDFGPLEPLMVRCLQGSAIGVEGFDGKVCFLAGQAEKDGHRPARPLPLFTLEQLEEELKAALQLTTGGKFSDAARLFENVLLSCLFLVIGSEEEKEAVLGVIQQCREYLRGLHMEHLRKELMASDEQRSLSLACYFATCVLGRDHLILALRSALTQAYKLKCIALAGRLARRLLGCEPPEGTALQARKIIALADKLPLNHADPLTVELGDSNVDARDFVPIAVEGEGGGVSCPLCGALYRREHAGTVCNICRVAEIGISTTGFVCTDN